MSSRPPIKAMNELFAEQRIEFQNRMIRAGHWQSCIKCEFWQANVKPVKRDTEDPEVCSKYNARPPAHVIACGCPDYFEDIPF